MSTAARSSSRNSRVIDASREKLYEAFTSPEALMTWQAPGAMTAKIHHFDHRVGGGYEMSLFYPDDDNDSQGKTAGKEDRYTARFVELVPARKIVQAITFDTQNPEFAGEMIMEVTFVTKGSGTEVTVLFKNIPHGISAEDNEEGTASSLEKLAAYVAKE